jgi:hypothetical protein
MAGAAASQGACSHRRLLEWHQWLLCNKSFDLKTALTSNLTMGSRACLLLSGLAVATATATTLPFWTAPQPNGSLPLSGYAQIPGAVHTPIYFGDEAGGWYNHAAMLALHGSTITVRSCLVALPGCTVGLHWLAFVLTQLSID